MQASERCPDVQLKKFTYPLQISVHHMEFVHIPQPIRSVGQLNGSSVMPSRIQVKTYELGAVHILIPRNKVINVSILHPLGNQRKAVLV